MPRPIRVKVGFERACRRLSLPEQHLVDKALQHLEHYLQAGSASVGLGVKHLGSRTYECRAGLSLRIIYQVEREEVILSLSGTHDEVRRFLKR